MAGALGKAGCLCDSQDTRKEFWHLMGEVRAIARSLNEQKNPTDFRVLDKALEMYMKLSAMSLQNEALYLHTLP